MLERHHIAGIVFLALVVCVSYAFHTTQANASDQSGTLYGYAWSDTIGWISLNCTNTDSCETTNYAMNIDANGQLYGHAWSDNVGWISAQAADLSGCPQAPCTARLQDAAFDGWLRALAGGTAQSGGWDGFVSLSGAAGASAYGVTVSNDGTTLSGYAWGDTNLGWIDFRYASTTSAACPTGYAIADGACVRACAPAYSCSGQTIQYTDARCNVSTVTTCVSPQFCLTGSASCLVPEPVFNASSTEATSGHLTIRPTLVRQGQSAKLFWNVSNVESCTVSGGGESWTSLSSPYGGRSTGAINGRTTYTLECQELAGAGQSSFTESVTVNITPVFQEL